MAYFQSVISYFGAWGHWAGYLGYFMPKFWL